MRYRPSPFPYAIPAPGSAPFPEPPMAPATRMTPIRGSWKSRNEAPASATHRLNTRAARTTSRTPAVPNTVAIPAPALSIAQTFHTTWFTTKIAPAREAWMCERRASGVSLRRSITARLRGTAVARARR